METRRQLADRILAAHIAAAALYAKSMGLVFKDSDLARLYAREGDLQRAAAEEAREKLRFLDWCDEMEDAYGATEYGPRA